MKKQLLYIHGGDSYSNHEDFLQALKTKPLRNLPGAEIKTFWSATLVEDLGDDFEIFMLAMPNKQNAKYEEWKIWLERHFTYLQNEIILVGWSLGGMFLAKYLSENKFPVKIKSLYLLAAPSGEVKSSESGEDAGSFRFAMNLLKNIPKLAENINIWHSKDDFVVPYEEFLQYKNYLPQANFVSFEDKNHFLIPKFLELIADLKRNS